MGGKPTYLPGTVQIAYVHPGTQVEHCWAASMQMLWVYDALHDQRSTAYPPVQMRVGTDGLPAARNSVMAHFLDKTDAEWVFLIDTDMGFPPDILDRLIEAAQRAGAGAIGALCFGLKLEPDPSLYGGYAGRPFPTIYQWRQVEHDDGTIEPGFKVEPTYQPDTVMRVAGTGAAALLVHRTAAAAVRAQAKGEPVWFDRIRYKSGTLVSEDLSFCYRLGRADVPVFVHTGVKTVHAKQVWVGEDYYLQDRAFRMMTGMFPPVIVNGTDGVTATGAAAAFGDHPAVPIPDEELDDPTAIHARVALAQVPEVSDGNA